MGFKPEQFVKKVDDNLICPICHEVFEDPVNCKTGHTFCRDCIEEWLQNSNTCPMDNGVLEERDLVPVYTVRGIIDNQDVYCHPQDTEGLSKGFDQKCDWTGKLHSYAKHRGTCLFQEVKCPNMQCNRVLQRRELEDHDKICIFKEVECEKCQQGMLRRELVVHKVSECPEALTPCPNKCRSAQGQVTRMKRLDLNEHLTNTCVKSNVECPFKEQGCLVQVERQHLDTHVKENMAVHMTLLAKRCSSLTEQCWALTEKCSTLTEKCSTLTEQCSTLTEQCSTLTEKCSSLTEKCSSLTEQNTLLKQGLRQVKLDIEKQQEEILSRSCYIWEIQSYATQFKKHPSGSWFRSPTFWMCGYSWYLQIYPNGVDSLFDGYLSLYLCLGNEGSIPQSSANKSVVPPSRLTVSFKLSVKSCTVGIQDRSFTFTELYDKDTMRWGKDDFMLAADAVSSNYCDISLTVICYF